MSDIVQANLLALENDGADYQAVNIASGEPISIAEVAQVLAAAMGRTFPRSHRADASG